MNELSVIHVHMNVHHTFHMGTLRGLKCGFGWGVEGVNEGEVWGVEGVESGLRGYVQGRRSSLHPDGSTC